MVYQWHTYTSRHLCLREYVFLYFIFAAIQWLAHLCGVKAAKNESRLSLKGIPSFAVQVINSFNGPKAHQVQEALNFRPKLIRPNDITSPVTIQSWLIVNRRRYSERTATNTRNERKHKNKETTSEWKQKLLPAQIKLQKRKQLLLYIISNYDF